MDLGFLEIDVNASEVARTMLQGLAEGTAALCLCDTADVIRYANPAFRAAFCPGYDGSPADFMDAIVTAMQAGAGLRIASASPDAFAASSRQRRQRLVGSHSFSADMMDGSWWSVTDTKLSNGWILIVAQDISALKDEEARLRAAHDAALSEAQTDFLTGIPNRRYGLRRAEQLWKEARRAGVALSVALFDIDHFKAINDIYGHEVGDRALVHFAQAMQAAMAPEDAFSRLGGDEFLMIKKYSDGLALRDALSTTIAGLLPLELQGGPEQRLPLSISVGVAEARDNDTWAGLMHRADMSLYAAKAGGRCRIEVDRSRRALK